MSLFKDENFMSSEPSIGIKSVARDKPGVWFHNVNNGLTARLVLQQQINENIRVYIPNGSDRYTTDPDGVKSIMLVTEERFNHWWNEVKTWLDQNLENTIISWVEKHWDEQFQPHLNDTITRYNKTLMNDNDNSLRDNEEGISYVVDDTQPRGIIPKIHDTIINLKSKLTKEIQDRKDEDRAIRTEILQQLPVGTMLALYKSGEINKDIKNWYLRCDGSVIPTDPKYNELRSLLGGSTLNSPDGYLYRPTIRDVYYGREYTNLAPMSRLQWGTRIARAMRSAGLTTGNFPIPLTERSIIRILNQRGTQNDPCIPDNFPLNTIMGNNFRSSSFGACNKNIRGSRTYIGENHNLEQTAPMAYNGWVGNDVRDPYGQMEGNQVERLKHVDIYNPTVHFRVKNVPGYSELKRLQVAIGQSNTSTSVWDNDLELDVYVDLSPGNDCGYLLYLEIGNRDSNQLTAKFFFFIPFGFLNFGPDTNTYDVSQKWKTINAYRNSNGLQLFEIGPGSPIYYGSQNYAGMNGVPTAVIELNINNDTGSDYVYMRLGGMHQGRTSNVPASSSDDSRTKPILHPMLVYGGESPTSLWSMAHSAFRRWDGYVNYNYWYHAGAGAALTESISYGAYFNRFRINTDGWLYFLGLDRIYTTEQWKTFWDELIEACADKRWTPGENNAYTTYPRIGGVDILTLPRTPSSSPSGFSSRTNFGDRAKGANFGFSFKQNPLSGLPTDSPYHIRGCRTVLHIRDSDDIYLMIDTDGNNTNRKNGHRGFILHDNGSWKDLGYHLPTYATNGNVYVGNSGDTSSSGIGNKDWGWKLDANSGGGAYESAGLCRIRIYLEGEHEPYVDVMFCEFASNKGWEDGRGGSAGDEGGVGYGFDFISADEYILRSIRRPGNLYNNVVVVIDRIHNMYNFGNSDKPRKQADAWDCFDMSYFIDYCNHGNKLQSTNKIKLPDLTRDGVFIGGGSTPGIFNRWTMPNLRGGMAATAEGAHGHWGIVSNPGGGNDKTPRDVDWSGAPGFKIDLNNDSYLRPHIGSKIIPDYNTVEYWMKFK